MRTFVVLGIVTCAALAAACGPGGGDECMIDDDCRGDLVCARNTQCLPASEVRVVRVTWTVRGEPASAAACASAPELYVLFYSAQVGDAFGFAPVPCEIGLFTIDKLPRRYVSVEIGEDGGFSMERAIDANGEVMFDLAP